MSASAIEKQTYIYKTVDGNAIHDDLYTRQLASCRDGKGEYPANGEKS